MNLVDLFPLLSLFITAKIFMIEKGIIKKYKSLGG